MLEVARSPQCDLGTALLVYWLADPNYWFANYATLNEVPRKDRNSYTFLLEIENRVTSRSYQTAAIPFDPANFHGNDLTEQSPGAKLKRKIPKLMFGPFYSGPRERPRKPAAADVRKMTAKQLHDLASKYDWQSGVSLLNAVIDNPNCDAGTALMLYWRCDPHFFDCWANTSEVDEDRRPEFRLLTKLEKRIAAGYYSRRRISFDPKHDNPTDWTIDDYGHTPKRRKIPPQMYIPTP